MNSSLTANLAETMEFLARLPSADAEHMAVILEGRSPLVRSFAAADQGRAIRWLKQFQGTHNCYFHANPLRPETRDRKARRDDVAAARLLHVDIDDLTALERIAAFPVPPSVVVMSGGGYQCLWFLRSPASDLARVEAINRIIADQLGGDTCHSVDHLLRLPGTLNVPNEKKRSKGREVALARLVPEHTDFSRYYEIEDVERTVRGGMAWEAPAGRDATVLYTAEDLPIALPTFTLSLIQDGDDLQHSIGQPKATYQSRSEVVFRVACDMAKAGADLPLIVGVLTNPANGIAASILEKARPELYAARQAVRALQAVGDSWPVIGKSGQPTPCFANAMVALPRLGLRFEFDAFHNRRRVDGHPMQTMVGELSDDICATIRQEALAQFGVDFGKENVRDAAHTLAIENTYHPINDYLDSLRWDGQPRLARWLTLYTGAEDTPLHQAMATLVLVAAVRRVRQPGAKFDNILVLEGPQGSGKSSAIVILAGEANFSDQEILTLDTKGQMEALEGVWLYELGELQGLGKAEVDKVKAFASRRFDRARPAYGYFRIDRPRQTIFIGTTNDEQYLRDATGNRRFWPVTTTRIDLEGLRRDRDQLWAEAAALEAQGISLKLAEELWSEAASAQEARLVDDPWLEALQDLRGKVEAGVEKIRTADALAHLEMPADRQNPSSAKRIVHLLRKLGWTGPKRMRIGGVVLRGYERPSDQADTQEGPLF